MTVRQAFLLPWLLAVIMVIAAHSPARAASRVDIHFFSSAGCPHCRDMAVAVDKVVDADHDVVVHRHDIAGDAKSAELFARTVEALNLPAVVPIVIIGQDVMIGHEPDAGERLLDMIARCRAGPCPDLVTAAPEAAQPGPASAARVERARTLRLPVIGAVQLSDLSLPVLTIAMAAIDGFNPCAMWVLVFLIGLLLGIRDRRRMWVLAATFLLATAAIYFLFLAAWLNLLLVLGALTWLRILIGALAIAAGGHYLRSALQREQVCEVTQPERRRRTFDRLRRLVQEPSLGVAMVGVALLAMAVNLVELACSAGIPAVYTGILAQSDLTQPAYYGYLALYILVFLADDAALVVIAMTTLKVASMDNAYSRWVRIGGGVVMLCLGTLLILRPEWLAFG
jgi:hypothetical protein